MAKKSAGKGDGRGYGDGSKWRLPSGAWRIQFYLDGRSHTKTYPAEQAADARLEEVRQLKAGGYDIASGLQTVRLFYADWLDRRRRSARALRTKDGDDRIVEGYIMPAIGDMALSEVRASHLIGLLNRVQADIQERSGGRFSGARTAQLVATMLTQAFEAAVKQRLIAFSPMDGVEIPSYDRAEVEPAGAAQLAGLLKTAQAAPMPALWYLYALLGLRRGEGLGIRLSDLDLSRRTVMIAQQVQAVGNKLEIVRPKGKKGRVLPLPLVSVPWLEQRITQVKAMRLKAGPAWQDHDLLFCGPDGRPLWPTTVDHWWRELRNAAQLPAQLTLHSLRHSFMTMLDETAITEAMKGRIMGHAKKNVTQRYTHPTIEAMRRAIEEVAQRVTGAEGRAQTGTEG